MRGDTTQYMNHVKVCQSLKTTKVVSEPGKFKMRLTIQKKKIAVFFSQTKSMNKFLKNTKLL